MRKKVRKFIGLMLTVCIIASFMLVSVPTPCTAAGVFFDDFTNGFDTSKWLIAKKQWGGINANGGVIPQNVSISNDGVLVITGNGDLYTGPLRGINKDGSIRADGKRTGACIVTKDYFASGSYEVRMKVLPRFGACSALWTFFYYEAYPGDPLYKGTGSYYVVNHEIDIEQPGRPGATHTGFSFNRALCNTWEGENTGEYTTNYVDWGYPQNDGQWHTYRFDWHTNPKKVDFYVDGTLKNTCTTNIPTIAGRYWVGVWFPNGWAGTPNFDSDVMLVDWVRITPFNESGDQFKTESYPNDGWAAPNEYPTATGTPTPTPSGATATPTPTPVSTATPTPTPIATSTPTPTPVGTSTPTPVATSTPTPTPGSNKVSNAGFETGSLSPWTIAEGNCAVETANPRTGTYNAKLTPDNITTSRVEQVITGLSPNTTYTFKAWVKTSGIWGYIGVKNYGGNLIEVGSTSTSYVEKSITFTTGATNTTATIYLQTWKQQIGFGYFDDVSVN